MLTPLIMYWNVSLFQRLKFVMQTLAMTCFLLINTSFYFHRRHSCKPKEAFIKALLMEVFVVHCQKAVSLIRGGEFTHRYDVPSERTLTAAPVKTRKGH